MKRAKRELSIAEQWIEVCQQDGVTKTAFYPSNDDFLAEVNAMSPPPVLIYRRIHFPAGVPREYFWTRPPDDQTILYGGGCVQRMTLETWIDTVGLERSRGDGHIGPTGKPPVPRPNERGGCECPTCLENEDQLAKLGLQI